MQSGDVTIQVIDANGKTLSHTTPARARILLAKGRATVKRNHPFVIQLREGKTMSEEQVQMDSYWVRNVSDGRLRIKDLKLDKDVDSLILEDGEAINLFSVFPVERVRYSRGLNIAIQEGWIELLPEAPSPDDMVVLSDASILRQRMNDFIKKEPEVKVENGQVVMAHAGGVDPELVAAARAFVSKRNEYDDRFDQVERQEVIDNLRLAGRVKMA